MSVFRIEVAKQIIQVKTMHEYSRACCRDFIIEEDLEEEKLNLQIQITAEDISRERRFHEAPAEMSDAVVEFSALLRRLSQQLLSCDTILMHGAVVADEQGAYLFTGKSGTGKTTHIRRWLRELPEAYVVNGDKPFIIAGEGEVLVCGSPWAGKEKMYRNTIVPLKAIIQMERADKNVMEKISFSQAFPALLQQTYRPKQAEQMRRTLSLLGKIQQGISFYRFHFDNFSPDVFQVAYDALHDKTNSESHSLTRSAKGVNHV